MPRKKNTRVPRFKPASATYRFVRSAWGRTRKRWLHLYRVYPPAETPFLPSDEALKTLVGTIPDVRFHGSARFSDHDLFFVYGRNKNLFTARAGPTARAVRQGFLRDVASVSLKERPVPEHVQEASKAFLSDCGFVNVEWDGRQAIAYDKEGWRHEGRRVTGGTYWRPFRDFEHLCRPVLPFFYRAAPS